MTTKGQKAEATYTNPLSIFFIWHPLDQEIVAPIFNECFASLSRDVKRPFSRSVNIPVFSRTCAVGKFPNGIQSQSRRSVAFAFLSANCISDEPWVAFMQMVAKKENLDFVPIALDCTAFNAGEEIERVNFIRAYEFASEIFNQQLLIAIFHEIYRYGLNESRKQLNRGKESSLKLFLSHAKDGAQGVALATALKDLIQRGSMRQFFDATDIAPGYGFETEIVNHIRDSTLIAIHSDAYSSRYWCQREVLSAKDYDRPIIAVDLLRNFEDRRFPLAGNIPAIRIPVDAEPQFDESHLLTILQMALLETIRFCYSWLTLSEYQAAGWFPSNAVISARPPEACVLARVVATIPEENSTCSDFVYPDPPIYPEEARHFERFGLNPITPLTSLMLNLSSKRVGISISEPAEAELLKIGQTNMHLALLLQDVARYCLCYGAELVYGGDLRPGGFTEFLFQEGQALQNRMKTIKVHLTNHIAWPIYLADSKEMRDWKAYYRKVATMIEHCAPEDVLNLIPSTMAFLSPSDGSTSFVWSRSLSEMRKAMIGHCDFRISAGGRLTGYKGCMPGVLEEIALAIEMERPIYLIGGFGGVTHSVCRLISEKTVPEDLTFEWQLANNPGLGDMVKFAGSRGSDYELRYQQVLESLLRAEFRNGLSPDENTRLYETPFVDEVIHLLLKGMSRL